MSQSGCTTVDNVDDEDKYIELVASMRTCAIDAATQRDLFRALAALLHLGAIDFDEDGAESDGCRLKDERPLRLAARLLGCAEDVAIDGLTHRTMSSGGRHAETYKIPLKAQDAAYARDTLCKWVYANLFAWLVRRINICLLTKAESRATISVLDIFGFEVFEVNSFEQLCINFANEKLQGHFNACIFKQEQEIYMREAIKWEPIDEPDNEECIAMLESRTPQSPGIFHILDEQCRLAKATDEAFTRKVYEVHNASKALARPRHGGGKAAGAGLTTDEAFVVRHYAGEVCYYTYTFLDKNNNVLHADLEAVVQSSSDAFVQEVLGNATTGKENETAAPSASSARLGQAGAGRGPSTLSRFSSVSGQFVKQLGELIAMLRATNSHFVRCINPNTRKAPGAFDGGRVLAQLRCSGMIEALRLMHAGFPTRCPYDDLYDRYKSMMPKQIAALDSQAFCEVLLMALGLDKGDYQLGITRVFFRAGKLAFLDSLRSSEYEELAPDIVNKVRVWLIRRRFRRHTIAVVAFLRINRTLSELRARNRIYKCFRMAVLLTNRPMLSLKRARELLRRRAATTIQAYARRQIVLARQHRELWATFTVQRLVRGFLARARYGPELRAARATRAEALRAERTAAEEAKRQSEREELERVRQLANAAAAAASCGPGTSRFADPSRYASKQRPAPGAAMATAGTRRPTGLDADGGWGEVDGPSPAIEERFKGLEDKLASALEELAAERKAREALEQRLAALESKASAAAEGPSLDAHPPPSAGPETRRQSFAAPGSAARRQTMGPSTKGAWSVGLLDLLGLHDGGGRQGAGGDQRQPPTNPRQSTGGRTPSVIPPPTDALGGLHAASQAILSHFHAAGDGNAREQDLDPALGDDSQNKEIAVLVRGQLCTALSRVMLHGFKSFKLIGRFHIWDFVQSASDAVRSPLLSSHIPGPAADCAALRLPVRAPQVLDRHSGSDADAQGLTEAERSLSKAVVEVGCGH